MRPKNIAISQNLKLRLLLDHQPWRVLLPLHNLRMTEREILALFPYPEQGEDPGFGPEICGLLAENREYRLQIEQEDGFFSEPYVHAELVRKHTTTLGWELNFRFINASGIRI